MLYRLHLAVVLLSVAPLWAQRYLFQDYRQQEGLPNLVVTSMLQDRNHFLWIGTQNGLYRFDGARFEAMRSGEALAGAFILALAEGADGALWVSTHQGLSRVQGNKVEELYALHEASDEMYLGLGVGRNGDVYVGTTRGLLVGKLVGSQRSYVFLPGMLKREQSGRPVLQIAMDAESRAWFGCGHGICRSRGGVEFDYLGPEAGVPPDEYTGALFDHTGRLYVRSRRRILSLAPGEARFRPMAVPVDLSGPPLLFAGRGRDLFVPHQRGLAIWKSRRGDWHLIEESQGISGERLSVVLEDHENSLWLGLTGDGAKRWLGYEEWEGYTKADGLSSEATWGFVRDASGVLWVATDRGLNWFEEKRKRWHPYGGAEGASWGKIYSLIRGPGDLLYALSLGEGLVVIDSKRRTHELLGKPRGQRVRLTYSILLDRRGRLWLGSSEGVFQSTVEEPTRWVRRGDQQSEDGEAFFTITEDAKGKIWAAGNRGVISLEDEARQRWRRWTTRDGLKSNSVWYAREVRPGEYWFGYLDSRGGSRMKLGADGSPQWMHVVESGIDGVPAEFVSYFNGVDRAGRHWMGTDRGVFVVLPGAASIRNFTDQDGLVWNDCNSNAFFADADGSVWIGTSRGIAHAHLTRPLEKQSLPLRLHRVRVGEQEWEGAVLSGLQEIRVPAKPNQIEFEASPVTFRFASRLQFRYRMESEGSKWEMGKTGRIAIQQLAPGEDRIEVQVKQDRLPWSESLRLPLRVEATFGESWQGRSLLGLGGTTVLGLLITWLWRNRNQRLLSEKVALEAAIAERTAEIQKLLIEARQANQLKSEFLANMSHEIRTPMNGVLGMLQLIEGGELGGEQREYVGLAKGSAESLLSLLNEILDLSKVESGQVVLEETDFSLGEALRQVVGLMEASARRKGLRLEYTGGAELEVRVRGDGHRLKQVLLNLLGNAVKFTPAGRVALQVSRRGDDEFLFAVVDEGIGIPREQQSCIFEAFRQADGSTTRRYGGTGLGLAISQRLVGLMGGRIEVESEWGEGSRFHFRIRLPLSGATGPVEEEAGALRPEVKAMRVLVAEDNLVNQLVAERMLLGAGHRVQVVGDGAAAVEAIHREDFDLVLMDVHMPVLDGLSATREIRQWEASGGGPRRCIYALTAGVMDEERKRCREAGMDGFLAKPLTREGLEQVLQEVAEAQKACGRS